MSRSAGEFRRVHRHRSWREHYTARTMLRLVGIVALGVLAVMLLAGCKDPGQSPKCKQLDPTTHTCLVWEGRT